MIPAAPRPQPTPRPTALFRAMAGASATNDWSVVGGWTAAETYADIEAEYDALTKGAGMFDLGCFTRYRVWGAEAGAFLRRLTTVPALRLDAGAAEDGLICDDRGFIVDLANVQRLDDEAFLLTTTAPRVRRMRLAASGLEASFDDISGGASALGLAGPRAGEALAAAGLGEAPPSHMVQKSVRGVHITLTPWSAPGAAGWQLIFAAEEALTVWDRLRRAAPWMAPAGLAALDRLRVVNAAARIGADFQGADDVVSDAEARTPFEAGFGPLAPLDSSWFNGRAAVRRRAADARRRALAGFFLEAGGADAAGLLGAPVYAEARVIGAVTSAAYDPRQRRMIALADIDAGFSERRKLEIGAARPGQGAPLRIEAERYDPAAEAGARSVSETIAAEERRVS